MFHNGLDVLTQREIDKVVRDTLREAGLVEPPVRIQDLLDHLRLYRDFYNLEDPTLLQRFWHKVQVQGHKLVEVVRKVKLAAVWLPDEQRILVDTALPPPKQEWASFHDSTHRILDWHRSFYLGDTAQTLDPDFQEMLEAEANYGASALMFCGPIFTEEALDTSPEWASVVELKKRYDKSFVTTLRRYIEHSHELPIVMVVSSLTGWTPRMTSKAHCAILSGQRNSKASFRQAIRRESYWKLIGTSGREPEGQSAILVCVYKMITVLRTSFVQSHSSIVITF